MLHDPLRKDYATLGVAPGASLQDIRRRYRSLVRKWHPDRFLFDPKGREEAESRLRSINLAYGALVAGLKSVPPPPREGERREGGASRRLTREEIQRMVSSIGTRNPIVEALRLVLWLWPVLVATVVCNRMMPGLTGGEAVRSLWGLSGVGVMLLCLCVWLRQRRHRHY